MTRALIDDGWTNTVYTDHDGIYVLKAGTGYRITCTCGLRSTRLGTRAKMEAAVAKHEAHCDGSTWKDTTSTL